MSFPFFLLCLSSRWIVLTLFFLWCLFCVLYLSHSFFFSLILSHTYLCTIFLILSIFFFMLYRDFKICMKFSSTSKERKECEADKTKKQLFHVGKKNPTINLACKHNVRFSLWYIVYEWNLFRSKDFKKIDIKDHKR